jgi:hypothetical protein
MEAETKQPDPRLHKIISFWKSALRIIAGFGLLFTQQPFIIVAGILIIVAEALGVAEEMV